MKIVNTLCLHMPTQIPDARFMAVLTMDDPGLYAVYVGIVNLPEQNLKKYSDRRMWAADWVAGHGAKQPLAHARVHFPFLTEKIYRV